MLNSLSLLASMTLAEKLVDAATVTIVGMGTVLLSLFLVGEIFAWLHHFFHGGDQCEGEETLDATDSIRPASCDEVPSHLIPILIAAATAAVGGRVLVRRITFINRNTVSGWAEAGRASIQSSHNLRRKM
jgi:hypothetical protein